MMAVESKGEKMKLTANLWALLAFCLSFQVMAESEEVKLNFQLNVHSCDHISTEESLCDTTLNKVMLKKIELTEDPYSTSDKEKVFKGSTSESLLVNHLLFVSKIIVFKRVLANFKKPFYEVHISVGHYPEGEPPSVNQSIIRLRKMNYLNDFSLFSKKAFHFNKSYQAELFIGGPMKTAPDESMRGGPFPISLDFTP
jgi:hypothetical protein